MESLMAMGFPEHMCSKAMRMTGGDVEAAANYIMGGPSRRLRRREKKKKEGRWMI